MFDKLLFIICLTCLLGMATKPSPVARFDPIFNSELTNRIKDQCTRNGCTVIAQSNCMQECVTAQSWTIRWGMDR